MWIDTIHGDQKSDRYFNTVGRAMYLCQNFEANFKAALVWMDLAIANQDGKLELSKEELFEGYAKKFLSQMLGHNIRRLKEEFAIPPKSLDALTQAKDSRNFLVHNAASAYFLKTSEDNAIPYTLKRLYKHIRNVAEGDNIVAAWNYEIDNRAQPPAEITDNYVDNIVSWIFSGFEPEDYLPDSEPV